MKSIAGLSIALMSFAAQGAIVAPGPDAITGPGAVVGGSIFVASDGEVQATFVAPTANFPLINEGTFVNMLFLDAPGGNGAPTPIFVNNYCFNLNEAPCGTTPGQTVSLGNFTAGTELVFRLETYDVNWFYKPRNPGWNPAILPGPGDGAPTAAPPLSIVDWSAVWSTGDDSVNPDGFAHAVVASMLRGDFDGPPLTPGDLFVGFDDTDGGASPDWNYTDMAFTLTNVVVPVPAAVWLFGSALGLLGVIRRRRLG